MGVVNHRDGFEYPVKEIIAKEDEALVRNFLSTNGIEFRYGEYGAQRLMIYIFQSDKDRNLFLLKFTDSFRSYEFHDV